MSADRGCYEEIPEQTTMDDSLVDRYFDITCWYKRIDLIRTLPNIESLDSSARAS